MGALVKNERHSRNAFKRESSFELTDDCLIT